METKSHKRLAWVKEEKENLYNDVTINMTPIYDKNKILLGYYNGTSAIAHDGKCIGQISITLKDSNKNIWVKGQAHKFKNGWKLIN